MKTFTKISLSIVLVIVLALQTSCQSQDYKKANELFESKKYSEAIEIYKELGDYEDSKSKIVDCKYKMLLEYINNYGSNYNDCKCIKYSNTDLSRERTIYLGIKHGNLMVYYYEYAIMQNRLSFQINKANPKTEFTAQCSLDITVDNTTARTEQTATGTIDLSTLNRSTDIIFSFYKEDTKDIYGRQKIKTVDENNSFAETVKSWFGYFIADFPKLLSSTNIDISVYDLGFKNLFGS